MYEKMLLNPGSVFIRENERCFDLFIIVSGKARALRTLNGRIASIAYFSKSDVVGEQSLLTGNPRSATVEAITAMEVIRVPFSAPIDTSKSQESQLFAFLLRSLINRVRHSSDRIASLELTIELQKVSLKTAIPIGHIAPELQRFILTILAANRILVLREPQITGSPEFLDRLLKDSMKLLGPSFLIPENVFETLKSLRFFGEETGEQSNRKLNESRLLDLVANLDTLERGVGFLSLSPVELEILTHTFGHVLRSNDNQLEKVLAEKKNLKVRLSDIRGLEELSQQPKYYDNLRSLQKKGWFEFEADSSMLQINVEHALIQNELLQLVKVTKLPILKSSA
jgi:CRP-like cAMP-binding protein